MKFEELNLDSEILAGVAAAGFEDCTEVQAQAIPHALNGTDVMVQSQTGTGKTAAFLLPSYHLLRNNPDFKGATALVVAPTRELAVQIKEESDLLAENLDIRTEVFHGGVGYGGQTKALADGLDVIVGTPGRMLDLSQSGHLDLKQVKIVIIDEADRLFDMGFYPDIRKMFRRLRPREERVNMLFSATLSVKARNIAWEHMNSPAEIEIEPEHVTVDKVTQSLYHVASEDKMSVILGVLKKEEPKTAIVFTNTKRAAEEVAKRLEINGYPSEFIIGDLPQRKRQSIIRRIKSGDAQFLVATDVAARGLHINDLDMVINYDLPEDPEAYVHRIGRTARAGESGKAVSLACQRYVFGLESIESLIRQKIPVETLSDELYAEDASAGMRIRTGDSSRDSRDRNGRDRGGRDRNGRGSGSRGGNRSAGSRSGGDGRSSEGRGSRSSDHAHTSGRSERGRKPRDNRDSRSAAHTGSGGDTAAAPRRRDDHRDRRGGRQRPAETHGAPKASDSLEARLEYYRRKYGEDFQPTDEMLATFQEGKGEKGSSRKRSSGRGRSSGRSSGRNRSGGADNRAPQRPRKGDNRSGSKENGADARKPRPQRGDVTNAGAQAGTTNGDTKPGAKQDGKKGLFGRLRSLFGGDDQA